MKKRGKRAEWERKKKLARPYLGTDTDAKIAKRFDLSKPVIQVMRSKLGIKPFGGPGARREKDPLHQQAVALGYPCVTVQKAWKENRELDNLMYTWKRTPRLRKFICALSDGY